MREREQSRRKIRNVRFQLLGSWLLARIVTYSCSTAQWLLPEADAKLKNFAAWEFLIYVTYTALI